MAEVLFYRLSAAPVEAALPAMLETSLDRGWRVLVRVGGAAGMGFLDERLWTYREDAFLPHGVAGAPEAARQPVLLTTGRENLNGATVLMCVMGASAAPEEWASFDRVCLIFDAADEAAVAAARADWQAVLAAGLSAKYWAQEGGRWVQKATS